MKNVAVLTEDRALALFFFPPRGIWQLKSSYPPEFAIQGKKMNKILKTSMENMKKWTNNIIVYRKYLILITFSSKIESLHSVFQDLPVMHDRAKLSNIIRVFTGQVGFPTY